MESDRRLRSYVTDFDTAYQQLPAELYGHSGMLSTTAASPCQTLRELLEGDHE